MQMFRDVGVGPTERISARPGLNALLKRLVSVPPAERVLITSDMGKLSQSTPVFEELSRTLRALDVKIILVAEVLPGPGFGRPVVTNVYWRP
jgi:hypothetical protein